MIRAANVGDQPLGDVIIHFSSIDEKGQNATSQSEKYGDLSPAERSEYHLVNGSFRYAPMEALVNGERVRMGVTDFFGEYAIPNGNYTYELVYGPRAMNGGVEDIDGQLIYDQTALDSELDSALDEEITIAILDEYYRESDPTPGIDGDDYGSIRSGCVHQQTHEGINKKAASVVVYAKVICKITYPQNERIEKFNSIFPLPIRIELQEQNNAFFVVGYQFPQKGSDYEQDIKKIFALSAIDEIAAAEIEAATYKHLTLKLL